ncbi:polysaccharide biosynthesis/export family protein [Mangrovimonas aestuarii]|uniref:polysaccharide biosynthesis/export family protein n=1 Tax=Mangrovimonas aestuarii TaxID=3018443 RepID=UPI002377ED31|nr:polysaccharide biosynthesis/export family protein [Mangrovimonas aestuarii]
MKSKSYRFLLTYLIILFIGMNTSCKSPENVVYFQSDQASSQANIKNNIDLVYKPNDMLTIDVAGLDPLAVQPFNLPAVAYSETVISAQGILKMQTYLIDNDGTIDFPVIGIVKIGGLTRMEATALLKEKISEYVKDPIVNIRLANFTITVLGEVNRPGTFVIQDEKVSLTEALGLAGDLTIYGKRENVFLIREENGVKQFKRFDLTSLNVVNDPEYYLQQNDVIYVEPNKPKVRSSSYNQNNVIIISAVATLATIVAILIK